MGGVFGVCSKNECVTDLFFGTDYHSHLGTVMTGKKTNILTAASTRLYSPCRYPIFFTSVRAA